MKSWIPVKISYAHVYPVDRYLLGAKLIGPFNCKKWTDGIGFECGDFSFITIVMYCLKNQRLSFYSFMGILVKIYIDERNIPVLDVF